MLEVDARDFDAATTHIIGRDQGGSIVAVARLLHTGAGQFYVGRVVVDPSARSQGVGRAIIREAGRLALLQTSSGECAELHLDAQVQAIDFYVGCGYELTDEPEFLDAGIPHRAMRRRVCADSQ